MKKVHNEPTGAYFFPFEHTSKPIKSKNHVPLHNQRVILEVIRKKHVNKKIQYGMTSMNEEE